METKIVWWFAGVSRVGKATAIRRAELDVEGRRHFGIDGTCEVFEPSLQVDSRRVWPIKELAAFVQQTPADNVLVKWQFWHHHNAYITRLARLVTPLVQRVLVISRPESQIAVTWQGHGTERPPLGTVAGLRGEISLLSQSLGEIAAAGYEIRCVDVSPPTKA